MNLLLLLFSGFIQEADVNPLSKRVNQIEQQYAQSLVKSFHNFLYGDFHGIKYLLNPRYCGNNMKGTDFKHQFEEIIFTWYGDDPTNATDELKYKMGLQYTNCEAKAIQMKSSNSICY
jgi:hypothetical protein